ncbi:suppressor of fused domain protein [Clostridium butyricum]|uniref:suppressor of fused domain protein n=1 Tax=Clostridium butyricum TaxID=1492 RepID=UPI003467C218
MTLVTNGMSSYPMRYSEKDNEFKYAELIIKLPSEWKLDEKNFKDEAYLWMANKNY